MFSYQLKLMNSLTKVGREIRIYKSVGKKLCPLLSSYYKVKRYSQRKVKLACHSQETYLAVSLTKRVVNVQNQWVAIAWRAVRSSGEVRRKRQKNRISNGSRGWGADRAHTAPALRPLTANHASGAPQIQKKFDEKDAREKRKTKIRALKKME